MKVSFTSFSLPKSGTVALLVSDGGKLSEAARQVDEATAGAVSNAIKVAGFKAEAEKTMEVIPPSGSKIDRVVLVGVGKASELTATRLEYAGGALAGALQSTGAGHCKRVCAACLAWQDGRCKHCRARGIRHAAAGLQVRQVQVEKGQWQQSRWQRVKVMTRRSCRSTQTVRRTGCSCGRACTLRATL
jgi:leucyl aminopeptidase